MFFEEMIVPSRFNDKIERSGEFLLQNNQLLYIQDFTPLFPKLHKWAAFMD